MCVVLWWLQVEIKARCMLAGLTQGSSDQVKRFEYNHTHANTRPSEAPPDESESEKQLQIFKVLPRHFLFKFLLHCILCSGSARCCSIVHSFPQDVDALYAAALDYFSDSAFLHVVVAQYLSVYRANRHLELMHVAAAEVPECSIPSCSVALCGQ